MQTKELNGNGKIIVTGIEIYAPHLGEGLAFSWPMQGPGYFQDVMVAIDANKKLRPTTAQTFSLIDLILQNQEKEFCKEMLDNFRNKYFWTSTENLWGKEDVIVYDNVDGKMPSDRKALIKRYEDGDKAVRIVPYGFKSEEQSVDEFLKNPYVIAQFGDEKMLEVAEKVAKGISPRKPFVVALNPTQEDVKRYTSMDSYWDDSGLYLTGCCGKEGRDGYASAVCVAAQEIR